MIDNLREQIQQRIDELSEEADRLRAALTALGSSAAGQPKRAAERLTGSSRRRSAADSPAQQTRRTRRPTSATSEAPSRQRSTGTRAAVLDALQSGEAMTASQVAEQTGLGRASVSTTLSKLAKSGEVQKAQRGYQIAGNRNGSGPQGS